MKNVTLPLNETPYCPGVCSTPAPAQVSVTTPTPSQVALATHAPAQVAVATPTPPQGVLAPQHLHRWL